MRVELRSDKRAARPISSWIRSAAKSVPSLPWRKKGRRTTAASAASSKARKLCPDDLVGGETDRTLYKAALSSQASVGSEFEWGFCPGHGHGHGTSTSTSTTEEREAADSTDSDSDADSDSDYSSDYEGGADPAADGSRTAGAGRGGGGGDYEGVVAALRRGERSGRRLPAEDAADLRRSTSRSKLHVADPDESSLSSIRSADSGTGGEGGAGAVVETVYGFVDIARHAAGAAVPAPSGGFLADAPPPRAAAGRHISTTRSGSRINPLMFDVSHDGAEVFLVDDPAPPSAPPSPATADWPGFGSHAGADGGFSTSTSSSSVASVAPPQPPPPPEYDAGSYFVFEPEDDALTYWGWPPAGSSGSAVFATTGSTAAFAAAASTITEAVAAATTAPASHRTLLPDYITALDYDHWC